MNEEANSNRRWGGNKSLGYTRCMGIQRDRYRDEGGRCEVRSDQYGDQSVPDQGLSTNQKSLPKFPNGSQATQASYKAKGNDKAHGGNLDIPHCVCLSILQCYKCQR